ncbi:MAG: class II glutamine amidotransferase [Methylobacteriaceae bacterium]|nr:class II glutamine amidotransferase [Methylobacteriaceae bacterium]
MCRWVAYKGEPIFLDAMVSAPCRSLIAQSLRAEEAKVPTNGDGFGVGWYGERDTPGLYREIRPAWSDENLRSLCAQVRSHLFMAHVRASTGSAIARANCHPFVHGRFMFVHNGQVGSFAAIRRPVEALIPDDLYMARQGTTDSEALFLAALAKARDGDPVAAMAQTLDIVRNLMLADGISEALRFTAALTDGRDLYAFRWASDGRAPTLYYRESAQALVIVSEPLDHAHDCWREVPKGCALVARSGSSCVIRRMNEAMSAAA